MHALPLTSHEELQATADWLLSHYAHDDPAVLRFAILEVLQNVVQHGNGLCFVEIGDDFFVVTNVVRESHTACSHIGLQMLEGVHVQKLRNAFRAVVWVDEIALRPIAEIPLVDLEGPTRSIA